MIEREEQQLFVVGSCDTRDNDMYIDWCVYNFTLAHYLIQGLCSDVEILWYEGEDLVGALLWRRQGMKHIETDTLSTHSV